MPSAAPTGVASVLIALWVAKARYPEERWELSFPFFFFFYFTTVSHLFEISTSQPPPPAYLYLILYPLCTLSLSVSLSAAPSLHSLSPTSIIYLSSIALFLVRCLPLSGKQLFLSAQPTLCPFTVSYLCSLTPPRLLLFISFPLSVPLSSPLIPTHSVFIRLCSLSQFG